MDQIKSKLIGLLLIPILSYGQEFVSVCDRTPQVRDAIMEKVGEIDDSIECSDTDLMKLMLSEIETLDLDDGGLGFFTPDIDSLKQGDFSGLSSLRYLELNHNELTSLPQGIFHSLSSLEYLNLSQNDIEALPDHIFSNLSYLQILDLRGNKLESLSEDAFYGLSSIKKILIAGNHFSFFWTYGEERRKLNEKFPLV